MKKEREIPILSFEKWLETGHGKRCLNPKDLTNGEYLKNRLWRAFHAGNSSKQIWMTSEVQDVLEALMKVSNIEKKIPQHITRRVQYILDHKEDYSLQKL